MPFFKVFQNYESFVELLQTLKELNCKDCRNGGSNPSCKIRECCGEKEIMGCWECNEFEKCEKLNFLCATHRYAHINNLGILKDKGIEEFIKGDRHW